MNRKIWLLAWLLLGLGATYSHAVPSLKVTPTSGNEKVPLVIVASSVTAINAYENSRSTVCWGPGRDTDDARERNFRAAVFQNPNSYDMMIGTWSGFVPAQVLGYIPSSTETWTTTNSDTPFFKAPPNASTGTVYGYAAGEGISGGPCR